MSAQRFLVLIALVVAVIVAEESKATPPALPSFLKGAPQKTIDTFNTIFANADNVTDAGIDKLVKEWVAGQSEEIKTKFASYHGDLQKLQDQTEAAHKAAIENFSPEAKEADKKLSEIADHTDLTVGEKGRKIQEFVKSLPEHVRKEIEDSMQGKKNDAKAPALPAFLKGAPQKTIDSFNIIFANADNVTDAGIDKLVEEWVGQQSEDIKTKFASYHGDLKKLQEQTEAAHKAAIESFSPEAKEADKKLSEIADHTDLTVGEKGRKIQEFVKSLPEHVSKEIEDSMQGKKNDAKAPALPAFLKGAPQKTIDSFNIIFANADNVTDAGIDKLVEEWVGQQSEDIKTKFASYHGDLKKLQEQTEAAHKAAIESFSPEAKEADKKLSEIADHTDLTVGEKGRKIQEFVKSLPEKVRKEIEDSMAGKKSS